MLFRSTDPLAQLFNASAKHVEPPVSIENEVLRGPETLARLAIHTNAMAIVEDSPGGDSS